MSETLSNANPDDEAQCFIDLEEIDSQMARLRQKKGTTIARYEGMGVDVESVRFCQKLKRKDSAPMWVRKMLRMAKFLELIPTEIEASGQVSMMPGLSQNMQAKRDAQAAFWKGYDDGVDGGLLDANPFPTGSENFIAYRDGWSDGYEDKGKRDAAVEAKKAKKKEDKQDGTNVTDAPTEVRKRGRPRKEAAPEGSDPAPRKAARKKGANGAAEQPATE